MQAVKNVGKTVFSVSLATATDKAAFYPIDNLIILRQSTGKGFFQLS